MVARARGRQPSGTTDREDHPESRDRPVRCLSVPSHTRNRAWDRRPQEGQGRGRKAQLRGWGAFGAVMVRPRASHSASRNLGLVVYGTLGLAVWARSHSRQARVTHGRPPTAPVSGGEACPAVGKAQCQWLNHVWTLPRPHGLQSARLLHPWILQARILERVAISLLQGNLPDPGTETGSPAPQADVFTVWAGREARNHRSQRKAAVLSKAASPVERPRGEERHFSCGGKWSPRSHR